MLIVHYSIKGRLLKLKRLFERFHEIFDYLDLMFDGQEGFMFSSTWTKTLYESYFTSMFGQIEYPLTRVRDR